MKNSLLFLFSILFMFLTACNEKPSLEELKKFAATENYPNDIFLDTVSNKKALVIVAHDDDDCAMSGTVAKLTANGWQIKQLSLQSHIVAKTGKNPAPIICQGNELILEDGYYRKGLDTMKTAYLPIPYAEIENQFLTEKVALAITEKVNEFNPSVIFTLDDLKGGYGHPEHIFISKLVLHLFKTKKNTTQKIYQSVYTNHMESEIVDKWLKAKMEKWGYPNASEIANAMYKIDGMPEPTTQINIVEVADKKRQYLMEYDESVRKNLRKFIPYYEEFDAKTYFRIFDREFFRVIEN